VSVKRKSQSKRRTILSVHSLSSIDTVLINGKIWTGNPDQPESEGIAISGGRVVAVGDSRTILSSAGFDTQIIDAEGRRVLPGFNDAHLHFFMGGETLTSVDLRQTRSRAEFRQAIVRFAQKIPKGEWILHGSWDHEKWSPPQFPDHNLIDDVTPDHPVWVNRSDGHTMLANGLAMKLAGVNCNTRDVPGGEIVRDTNGNPTGIFKDAAKRLVDHIIPLPSQQRILGAVRAAQEHAVENGVTSVQDMGVLGSRGGETMVEVLRSYQILEKCGDLKVRISAHIPLPEWSRLGNAGIRAHFGSPQLRIGAVKSFSDGSLGSTTAWFFDSYTDAPDTCGLPSDEMMDADHMYQNFREADACGLQLAIHAIGDRANSVVLDMLEKLDAENGGKDRRARIEHAQHLRPEDIPRFARQKIIASVQPYHCIDDGRWAEKRIGRERAKLTYAFRSLMDSGAVVAFGSDWFVAPISPLLGIYAAVTRRTLDGRHPDGWVPEQKISVEQAVRAYTVQSAYASGEEKLKGSLEPGKLADAAILSDDIFAIDPAEIEHVKVDETIFGGRTIYQRRK
jgi:predicted amidohydrolase YtcJ